MQLISSNGVRKISMLSWLIIIGCISLTGCSNRQHKKEVQQYIASIKARPAQLLPPLPPIKEYPVPKYEVANLRSPFQPTSVQASATQRPKEALENFPLDSLRLVGIITRNHQRWGLVSAPDGKLYQITTGHYLGQNKGRVIAVEQKHLDIVEMIEEGNRWSEHHAKLRLWSRSQNPVTAK